MRRTRPYIPLHEHVRSWDSGTMEQLVVTCAWVLGGSLWFLIILVYLCVYIYNGVYVCMYIMYVES